MANLANLPSPEKFLGDSDKIPNLQDLSNGEKAFCLADALTLGCSAIKAGYGDEVFFGTSVRVIDAPWSDEPVWQGDVDNDMRWQFDVMAGLPARLAKNNGARNFTTFENRYRRRGQKGLNELFDLELATIFSDQVRETGAFLDGRHTNPKKWSINYLNIAKGEEIYSLSEVESHEYVQLRMWALARHVRVAAAPYLGDLFLSVALSLMYKRGKEADKANALADAIESFSQRNELSARQVASDRVAFVEIK